MQAGPRITGRQRATLGGFCLLLGLAASGCGKTTTRSSNDDDEAGASASPITGGSAAGGVISGSAGSAARAGGGGGGTAPTPAGSGGSAGDEAGAAGAGGAATFSGVFAPLGIDDATLDAASGEELLRLAMGIGYARGYTVCTCNPLSPLSGDDLDVCARAESGFNRWFDVARARCLLEEAAKVPGFDDALRCRARALRAEGRSYADCAVAEPGHLPPVVDAPSCDSSAGDALLGGQACGEAFFCADGTLLRSGQCDQKRDCADSSDERGCRELVCGDQLIDHLSICDPEACPQAFDPPLCAASPWIFDCADQTQVTADVLCDGVKDCATGRDEQYCF